MEVLLANVVICEILGWLWEKCYVTNEVLVLSIFHVCHFVMNSMSCHSFTQDRYFPQSSFQSFDANEGWWCTLSYFRFESWHCHCFSIPGIIKLFSSYYTSTVFASLQWFFEDSGFRYSFFCFLICCVCWTLNQLSLRVFNGFFEDSGFRYLFFFFLICCICWTQHYWGVVSCVSLYEGAFVHIGAVHDG